LCHKRINSNNIASMKYNIMDANEYIKALNIPQYHEPEVQ